MAQNRACHACRRGRITRGVRRKLGALGAIAIIGYDVCVAQGNGSRATVRHAGIVSHDQDGRVQLLMQRADQVEDFGAAVRIEVAGGLVGQQDRGNAARDRAMATRWRSPPDSSSGW